MELTLDKSSPIPIGAQLQAQVRLLIQQRHLPPGTRLPTAKELAAQLDVNTNTVAAAYRQLETEGYLLQRRRAGTRVADEPPQSPGSAVAAQLAAGFAEALARCGLEISQGVTLAVAQANLRAVATRTPVAVLATTPLQAARAAKRTEALLGERFSCVPLTPESYRPADYGLCIVDPELAAALHDQNRRRYDLMPPAATTQYGPEFPAGAD
ncbi:MAG TPA: GntR family transcriptional regulator [Trueperaceae bacterium]